IRVPRSPEGLIGVRPAGETIALTAGERIRGGLASPPQALYLTAKVVVHLLIGHRAPATVGGPIAVAEVATDRRSLLVALGTACSLVWPAVLLFAILVGLVAEVRGRFRPRATLRTMDG